MSTEAFPTSSPAAPGTSLRDEQTELTRRRILDAVVRILAGNVADLNIEAVARDSGVSRPTVYRYFRTKREMVDAVGRMYAERIGTAEALGVATLDELLGHVPEIFRRYEQLEPELQKAAMSAETRGVSVRRREDRVGVARRLLRPHATDLSGPDRERLAQVVTVLLSSGTLRSMRYYLDLSPEEAGGLVAWAIRRLAGERKEGMR